MAWLVLRARPTSHAAWIQPSCDNTLNNIGSDPDLHCQLPAPSRCFWCSIASRSVQTDYDRAVDRESKASKRLAAGTSE